MMCKITRKSESVINKNSNSLDTDMLEVPEPVTPRNNEAYLPYGPASLTRLLYKPNQRSENIIKK